MPNGEAKSYPSTQDFGNLEQTTSISKARLPLKFENCYQAIHYNLVVDSVIRAIAVSKYFLTRSGH